MTLRVYQSLWAMNGLPWRASRPWSVPDRVRRIQEAGFDGIDIGWTPDLPAPQAVACAQEIGLPYGLVCFPRSVTQFAELVTELAELDPRPRYLNLQPIPKPFTPDEGARLLREWIAAGQSAGFRTLVETHRDRMTTDLRFTLQLLDRVPDMRLVADLSHFVVGQEFAWPIGEEDNALIARILSRSDMFHGRVASREQVQIPLSWPHHRSWLELFLGWWEQGFRGWRERAAADDELVFVTELGPPLWYAMTGPDGQEMSDRWEEALLLQQHVREIWSQIEGPHGGQVRRGGEAG